jgi:hypothetical protein
MLGYLSHAKLASAEYDKSEAWRRIHCYCTAYTTSSPSLYYVDDEDHQFSERKYNLRA